MPQLVLLGICHWCNHDGKAIECENLGSNVHAVYTLKHWRVLSLVFQLSKDALSILHEVRCKTFRVECVFVIVLLHFCPLIIRLLIVVLYFWTDFQNAANVAWKGKKILRYVDYGRNLNCFEFLAHYCLGLKVLAKTTGNHLDRCRLLFLQQQ